MTTTHDGNSGAKVLIKSYPGEMATLTCTALTPMIWQESDYWTYDSLSLTSVSIPTESEGIIKFGDNATADYCTIQNCTMTLNHAASLSNISMIRLQANRSQYALIKNNTFVGSFANHDTGTAIQFMGGSNVGTKIIHNVMHGLVMATMYKHNNTDNATTGAEWGYNFVYNCKYGVYGNPRFVNIHDNIFDGCGINFGDMGGGIEAAYDTIKHNTIYEPGVTAGYDTAGIAFLNTSEGCDTGSVIKDNIVQGQLAIAPWSTPTSAHATVLDYNLVLASATSYVEYATGYTLASWIVHYGGDSHSIEGSPTYTTVPPVVIADFKLTAGSTGHNAASNGADMGANIDSVGVQSGSSPSSPKSCTITFIR
jgi:hypothetical protein